MSQRNFTQLLTPPLLLLCFLLQLRRNTAAGRVWIALLLAGCTAWHALQAQQEEREAIQTQRAAMAMYAGDLESGASVRGCCTTAFYHAANGLPITENGQQQYVDTIWQPDKGVDWAKQRLLPYLGKNRLVEEELVEGIRAGSWQVIYTDSCTYMPASAQKELQKHYSLSSSCIFAFPGFKTELKRWELQPENTPN